MELNADGAGGGAGRFSLRLILHGRRVCVARSPRCERLRAGRLLPVGKPPIGPFRRTLRTSRKPSERRREEPGSYMVAATRFPPPGSCDIGIRRLVSPATAPLRRRRRPFSYGRAAPCSPTRPLEPTRRAAAQRALDLVRARPPRPRSATASRSSPARLTRVGELVAAAVTTELELGARAVMADVAGVADRRQRPGRRAQPGTVRRCAAPARPARRDLGDRAEPGRLPRPSAAGDEPVAAVRRSWPTSATRGDAAVRELTERFDGVRLDDLRGARRASSTRPSSALDPSVRAALEAAAAAHRGLPPDAGRAPTCTYRARRDRRRGRCAGPVDRAGCYVPGGRAAYPSTVLMTAVPARVAGVARGRPVRAARPPTAGCPTVTLAAAAIAGVDEVYRVGGAQAIAAMAYGTESIRPVDVIVGPGNVYVALAKREVAGEGGSACRRRSPARPRSWWSPTTPSPPSSRPSTSSCRPSTAPTAWPGSSPGTRPWPTPSTRGRPRWWRRRPGGPTSRRRCAEGGYAVLVDGPEQAIAVANLIAPEHLELHVRTTPSALVAAACATPARCSAGRGRRRRSATTSPARATCCPRTARPASPAPSPSTTSPSTSTSSPLDRDALAAVGAARRGAGRGRGPRRPRRLDPPPARARA